MVDFQTLNWNLSYVAQILCGLSYKVKSTIHFHNKNVNKVECNVQFCHGGGLAMLGILSISLSAEFRAIWKSDVVVV